MFKDITKDEAGEINDRRNIEINMIIKDPHAKINKAYNYTFSYTSRTKEPLSEKGEFKHETFFKSKKGITLPIVMIVAVVFLFVATVLTLNENLTRNVSHKVDTEDALQIAEAGYNITCIILIKTPLFYESYWN